MFKRVYYKQRIKLFESLLDALANLKENYATKWEVDKQTICLLFKNNVLYAFEKKCPHNGASLVGAKCTTEASIVCSLHRYAFSLIDGKAISNSCRPLCVYTIVQNENGIFISKLFEIKKKVDKIARAKKHLSKKVNYKNSKDLQYFVFQKKTCNFLLLYL